MGLFSDVKCGRCDRRYSGLKARCPYCGARRGKRGKHAKDYDNSKGRIIIGLILMVVLIAAVIVVIATSMPAAQTDDNTAGEDQEQTEQGTVGDSDGVTSIPGIGAGADDDAGADDTTEDGKVEGDIGTEGDVGTNGDEAGVATAVNDLYITNSWSEDPQTDFTANVGDVIQFSYVSDPVFEDPEVLWETSDDNVFVVLQTGEFTAIGAGSATLSLTVNGKTIELFVIVND